MFILTTKVLFNLFPTLNNSLLKFVQNFDYLGVTFLANYGILVSSDALIKNFMLQLAHY